MPKNIIMEAQNSNTTFEEGNKKGVLGKLAGVFADFKNGTRNANRLYNEKLWDRVLNSEDVEEAMNTKTLFGELDHPEGERCESLAQNAAITITKLEKRPDEGVIYGEAEILDTPTGRIVKALADSGAQLGISSRGMGEEVMIDGQNTIDPDTYDFITFDVVVTPANEKARVSLTEGKHLSKLNESLKKEIKECETENQLNQVKAVVENMSISNKDEMLGLIEEKLETVKPIEETSVELEKKEENVKLSEANKAIAYKLLETKFIKVNEKLDKTAKKLKATIEASNNKLEETKELNNKLEEEMLRKNRVAAIKLNNVNKLKVETLENNYKEEIHKLEESNKLQIKENERLNERLNLANKKFTNLLEENKKIENSIELTNKSLEEKDREIKNLKEQLDRQIRLNTKKLEESKIQEQNKCKKLEEQINALQAENKSLLEENEQFKDLSFSPAETYVRKDESFSMDKYNDDEKALFETLINK